MSNSNDINSLVKRFFGDGNEFKWSSFDINDASVVEENLHWASVAGALNRKTSFICLAHKTMDETNWYFGDLEAHSTGLFDDLRYILDDKSLGVKTETITLSQVEPVESILNQIIKSPCVLIKTSRANDPQFRAYLTPFFQALFHKPKIDRMVVRSSGVVRKDFEKSLVLKDHTSARRYLNEWKRLGRLDSENCLFLELHMNVSLLDFNYVYENEYQRAQEIKHLRVPPYVKLDVCKVLFSIAVEPYIHSEDWERTLIALNDEKFTSLKNFYLVSKIQSREIFCLQLFDEINKENSNKNEIERLCASEMMASLPLIKSIERHFLKSNVEIQIDTENIDEIVDVNEAAKLAYENGELEKSFELYLQLDPTAYNVRQIYSILLQTVDNFEGYNDQIDRALDFFKRLDEASLISLEKTAFGVVKWFDRLTEKVNGRQSETSGDKFCDWVTWLEWIEDCDDEEAGFENFQNHVNTWSVNEVFDDPETLNRMIEGFSENSENPKKGEILDQSLPRMIEIFVLESDNFDVRGSDLYFRFLDFLYLRATNIDLQLITEIQVVLLKCQLNKSKFADLVGYYTDLLNERGSFNTLDFFIDAAEAFSLARVAEDVSALNFFYKVLLLCKSFKSRLSHEQLYSLRLLSNDFSLSDEEWIIDEENEQNSETGSLSNETLDGAKISIYSLVEQAAKRAADYLHKTYPACQVTINNDKQCTDRLKSMAQNADIFVFAAGASKHQAYYCVKQNREGGQDRILMPAGKGTASIIRVLSEVVT
ncbi:hypothetical protein N9Y91_02735 [Alphaproteobacteria bacterium]|nr:hypothetical protein [Alphaproteobacteria bacterium]